MCVRIFLKTSPLKEMLTMNPSYPIGNFEMPAQVTSARRKQAMDEIASLPAKMRAAVKGLKESQLDTPYRAGGWTVRQLVHHVPDSHLNAYVRLKLALTEDNPTIKPYDQEAWSRLEDARSTPIEVSLTLLTTVHDRSEERRVGKECRSRWSPDHEKKKRMTVERSGISRQHTKDV